MAVLAILAALSGTVWRAAASLGYLWTTQGSHCNGYKANRVPPHFCDSGLLTDYQPDPSASYFLADGIFCRRTPALVTSPHRGLRTHDTGLFYAVPSEFYFVHIPLLAWGILTHKIVIVNPPTPRGRDDVQAASRRSGLHHGS